LGGAAAEDALGARGEAIPLRTERNLALALIVALLSLPLPRAAVLADDSAAGTVEVGGAEEPAEASSEPSEAESDPEPDDDPEPDGDPEAPAPPERRAGVGSQIFDALVLRPFGAVATLGGAIFFVISVPMVAPAKNIDVTRDIFLLGPYDYTFERPLGEF
jgi:hypothetical protein